MLWRTDHWRIHENTWRNPGVSYFQDTTDRHDNIHLGVDRGSKHVVEHHDDFFSWKQCNNYTFVHYIYTLYVDMTYMNSQCMHTMFSLCWPLTLLSRLEWVGSPPCSCYLHCHFVSSAVFFSIRQPGSGMDCIFPLSHTFLNPLVTDEYYSTRQFWDNFM